MNRKRKTTFNAAHKRWLKAQAAWREVSRGGKGMSEAAYDRLVDKTHRKREKETERLAAVRSQDTHQLACKLDALWDIFICDFRDEATAIRAGNFGPEEIALLKTIRRDADQLAGGRP